MSTTVTNSKSSANPDYAVKTTSTADGLVQHVNVDSSAGLTAQAATQTNSTVTIAKTILAANTSRKGGYIQAAWGNTKVIYLSLNSPATSADIPLAPGGVFNLTLHFGGPPITNAIYGISEDGATSCAYSVVTA